MDTTPPNLTKHPIHLGLGATAEVEPLFTGEMEWYQGYGERHGEADGVEGRLVSMHTFTESWDVWEMHPLGCLLYTSPSPRDKRQSRMPSSA